MKYPQRCTDKYPRAYTGDCITLWPHEGQPDFRPFLFAQEGPSASRPYPSRAGMRKFIIPKLLIAHFNTELDIVQGPNGWLHLEEFDFTRFSPRAFAITAYWLTDGALLHRTSWGPRHEQNENIYAYSDPPVDPGRVEELPTIGELAMSWTFGFTQGFPQLMNDCITAIYDAIIGVTELEVGWDNVIRAYSYAPPDSGLRRLLFELILRDPGREQEMIAVAQRWDNDLSEDVRAQRERARDGARRGLEDDLSLGPGGLDACAFHEHGDLSVFGCAVGVKEEEGSDDGILESEEDLDAAGVRNEEGLDDSSVWNTEASDDSSFWNEEDPDPEAGANGWTNGG